MAKRKNKWNKEIYKKRLSEKRGEGQLSAYKPWSVVQDFSSSGSTYRIKGIKTNRVHHLFSKTQYQVLLMAEFNDNIVDIRESFPLLDLYEILDNPNDIQLNKFRDKDSQELYVQTVFLFTCTDTNGQEYEVARTIAYASNLQKKVVIEGLELKRRYFELKGIEYKIITNKDIDVTVVKNIEYFREGADLKFDSEYDPSFLEELVEIIFERIQLSRDTLINEVKRLEKDYSVNRRISILLLKNLMWNKRLKWNLKEKFDVNASCNNTCHSRDESSQEVV